MGVEAALAHPDRIGKTSRSRDPRALRRWRDVPTREGWPAYHGSRRSAARGCSDPLSVLMLDNLAVNVRILPHRTTGRAIDKEWRACEHILGPQTRHRASPRQVSGPVLGPAGREVRRSSRPVQRAHRPQARSDRPLPDDGRRRCGARARAPGGTRGLDPRRRPQRRRPRRDGRRRDDRPRRDEGDRDRSRPGNRHGRGRRDLGGAERRRRRARPGGDRRRDLRDRDRRLHARRRPRLADGQAWARRRQPARGRARHGGGRCAPCRRRVARRSLLGASRRRGQLRQSRRRSRTACTRSRRSSAD